MVTFDPHVRLSHLEDYVENVPTSLPFEEARIELWRARLQGYKIIADIQDEGYSKDYIDQLIKKAEMTLEERYQRVVEDLFDDPCASQYYLLTEIRSYTYLDPSNRFAVLVRAEFKKIYIPTLRLLTELCHSEKKYSWDEVKEQLQQYMDELKVDVTWEACDAYLERYLEKVSVVLGIGRFEKEDSEV